MKLEFSGSPEIAAPRDRVWQRLMDPHFVAQSAPGVESVEVIDPTHFKVISGFGVGSIKVRFTMDVELFDVVPGRSARMRVRGQGAWFGPGRGIEPRDPGRRPGPGPAQLVSHQRDQRDRCRCRRPIDGGDRAQADRAVLD